MIVRQVKGEKIVTVIKRSVKTCKEERNGGKVKIGESYSISWHEKIFNEVDIHFQKERKLNFMVFRISFDWSLER